MKLSATIITYNEQDNIQRVIKSLSIADEIIVVDSGSVDETVKIAEKLGAKVYQNDFDGYGQQKNFAASKANGEWVLNLDADEKLTPELQTEILKIVNDSQSLDIYAVNRLTNYCGSWIRHGGWYPNFVKRLCRKDTARWSEPPVHEDLIPKNLQSVGKLKGLVEHYSFPTISSQIETNLKYAQLGSRALIEKKQGKPGVGAIILRPIGKFFECYFIKSGWRDGLAGFIIAVNAMHSMFMKYTMAHLNVEKNQ